MILKNAKTNWQYLLIIFILAIILAGGILWFSEIEEVNFKELSGLKKPEKIENNIQTGQQKKEEESTFLIRYLDKELISEKIKQGKEFLYRMENKDEKGFYKKYDALNDSFENRLHTVYSASIIYTFLYINDLEEDEEILANLSGWGDFLLFMQNKDEKDEKYGAFHYSYYLDKKEKEERFVVGTAALSIFTLLRLYDLTDDLKYLESAKLAGNWLATMQKSDGTMKPYLKLSSSGWVYGNQISLLYNGQVLSALAKLYQRTEDEKYYDVAEGIAQYFAEEYEEEQGYIEGEYRDKNPISNAWVVMSLVDFYKINSDERYKKIIFELSNLILDNQKDNSNDLLYHGGWKGAYSTSGTGWITEVMAETYRFCLAENKKDCQKYETAVIKAMRWLIQNTYSEKNSLSLKNSERAIGGVFWNNIQKYVRTDSVCHALNSYIRIFDYLDDGALLSVD